MNDLVVAGESFETFALTPEHGLELQRLLEACSDFTELTFGHPPGPAEAQSLFYAGPEEGADSGEKILVGIKGRQTDTLIGVLDAFVDYPEPGIWYIGLLLLHPNQRKSGLGAQVVDAFSRIAFEHGARELQLNSVEQNEAGRRFWERLGFCELRRSRRKLGNKESTLIRFQRPLI